MFFVQELIAQKTLHSTSPFLMSVNLPERRGKNPDMPPTVNISKVSEDSWLINSRV